MLKNKNYIIINFVEKTISNFKNECLSERYPSAFKVEITSRCNLKCITCLHGYFERPDADMSFEDFKSIIDRSPNLKLVDFTGVGESLLNKDFLKMLRYVKSKKIRATFYDNFCFIDKKTAEELIEIGVDEIVASIDGATKETYEKIRIGSNFEIVINNVKNLFELRKEKNVNLPKIFFNYVISKYNFGEIVKFVELVSSLTKGEKTEIIFWGMFSPEGVLEKFKTPYSSEIIKNTVQMAIKRGKELGIFIIHDFSFPQLPIKECVNYSMPFIFVTGEVIPCCQAKKINQDLKKIFLNNISSQNIGEDMIKKFREILDSKKYKNFKKENSLGNIFDQDFKEIWHSKKYRNIREMLRQGKVPSFCKNCPYYKI